MVCQDRVVDEYEQLLWPGRWTTACDCTCWTSRIARLAESECCPQSSAECPTGPSSHAGRGISSSKLVLGIDNLVSVRIDIDFT